MISALRQSAAALGITDVEVDYDWAFRQEPRWARGEKPLNPFQEMDFAFYPVMLRWKAPDGARRLAWLEPEIDTTGRRPKLDALSMGQKFFDLMRRDDVQI